MKSKIKHKKSDLTKNIDEKFIREQKYAEQGFQLDDPSREYPKYVDEKGIVEDNEEDAALEKLTKKATIIHREHTPDDDNQFIE